MRRKEEVCVSTVLELSCYPYHKNIVTTITNNNNNNNNNSNNILSKSHLVWHLRECLHTPLSPPQ